MHEVLPESGIIRKLWIGETTKYREHMLRLDPESWHRLIEVNLTGTYNTIRVAAPAMIKQGAGRSNRPDQLDGWPHWLRW